MVAMAKMRIGTGTYALLAWRPWVQTAFLLVWLLPLRLFSICSPVFHCYACPLATFACPIGIMASFSSFHVFPFVAVGTLVAVGGLVGAFICGWVCPFGYFQDLVGKIPTPKLKLPAWTGLFRYAVLAGLVLAVPFFFGKDHPLFICSVCPAGALEGAAPNMVREALAGRAVTWPNAVKLTVVGVVLVGMFFKHRPWCTLFCPLGAIFGSFNRVSLFFLRYHPGRCDSCGACHRQCRYGLMPDRRANDPRCIRCLECTRCGAIPIGNALSRGNDEPEKTPTSNS